MLKKILKVIILAIPSIGLVLGLTILFDGGQATYAVKATVYAVEENGTVFKDSRNEYWKINETNYTKGEDVTLIMDTNGTNKITDDIILRVEKTK